MVADPIKPTRQELAAIVPQADYRMLRALERLFERAGEELPDDLQDLVNRLDVLDTIARVSLAAPDPELGLPAFINMVQRLPVEVDDFPQPIPRIPIPESGYAGFSMTMNNTATTFTATNTPTKALGSTTAGPSVKFAVSDNEITLQEPSRPFSVIASFGLAGTASEDIFVAIAVNDTPASIMPATLDTAGNAYGSVQALLELSVGDDVEIFLANGSTTNSVTLTQVDLIAREL